MLFKVPVHTGIVGNKKADKDSNEATTLIPEYWIPHTDYNVSI